MSNLESGKRASKQPHITLEEMTTLRNHWLNIFSDFELLHELYNERNPGVAVEFARAKLPGLDQMETWADEIRVLFETVREGATPQRDQVALRYRFERLSRLRNNTRTAINRSREALHRLFPEIESELSHAVRAEGPLRSGIGIKATPHQPSFQAAGSSHGMNTMQPQFPAGIPRPSQFKRPRHSSSSSEIPPIAQRLNPGYHTNPFSPTYPPQSGFRPNEFQSSPFPDHQEIRRLREENSGLRAENAKLREYREMDKEEIDRLNEWFKLQEQEAGQKDKEIQNFTKEKKEGAAEIEKWRKENEKLKKAN